MQYAISKLKKINKEYLTLLNKFKNKVNDKRDLQIFAHTLACFWVSNKQIILFCVDSLRLNYDKVSIYTGACDLGFNLNEHGSFILSNQFKLYDDPILRYLLVISNWEQQADLYLKKILFSLSENISILEEHYENLFIIPLSYLYKDASSDFVKGIEDNLLRFIFDYQIQSAEEILKLDYSKLLTMLNFDKIHCFSFSGLNITKENFEKEMLSFVGNIISTENKTSVFYFAFFAIVTSALNAIFLQINTGFDLLLRPDYLAKNVASIFTLIENNIPEIRKVLNGMEKYYVLAGNYFNNEYSRRKLTICKQNDSLMKPGSYFFDYIKKDSENNLEKLIERVDLYLNIVEKGQ